MLLQSAARLFILASIACLSIQANAGTVKVTACKYYNKDRQVWDGCEGPFMVNDLMDLRTQVVKALGSTANPAAVGIRALQLGSMPGKPNFKEVHRGDDLARLITDGHVQYSLPSPKASSIDAGTGGTASPIMPAGNAGAGGTTEPSSEMVARMRARLASRADMTPEARSEAAMAGYRANLAQHYKRGATLPNDPLE